MTCLPSPSCPCCFFLQYPMSLDTTEHSLPLFHLLNSLAPLGLAFLVPSWGFQSSFLYSQSILHPSPVSGLCPGSFSSYLSIFTVSTGCPIAGLLCMARITVPTSFACPHPFSSHTQSILCLGAHTFCFHDNVCLSFLSQYHFRRYSLLIIISLCVPGHPDTCREVSKLLHFAFLVEYPKRGPQVINWEKS